MVEFTSQSTGKPDARSLPSGVSLQVERCTNSLSYEITLRVPYEMLKGAGLGHKLFGSAGMITSWLLIFGTVARAMGWRLERIEDES